jgi:hypothetical protein
LWGFLLDKQSRNQRLPLEPEENAVNDGWLGHSSAIGIGLGGTD